jgi:sec-independent protein translocase protein TatA
VDVGPAELLIVLVVVLLLFGPKRLPNLARSIGEAARELRHGAGGAHSGAEAPADPEEARPD